MKQIKILKDHCLGFNREELIGYEVEINSKESSVSESFISKKYKISFDKFLKTKLSTNLFVKMSHEYYSSTIEFNFLTSPICSNIHNDIVSFMETVFSDNKALELNGKAPSFTGTHIHLFGFKTISNVNPDDILLSVMQFIYYNINDLEPNSLLRIIDSHQLWGNYHMVTNRNIGRILMEELGKEFRYTQLCSSRQKYRPVIFSPRAKGGKQNSLEIRLIPNELLMNHKLRDWLNNTLIPNIKGTTPDTTFKVYNNVHKEIEDIYREFCIKYRSLSYNRLDHEGEEDRPVRTSGTVNRLRESVSGLSFGED